MTDHPAYILRPHQIGDMGWVVHRQSILYAAEYGFDSSFEALIAHIVADFLEKFDPARERCWIAERNGAIIGQIFLVAHREKPGVAKLRLLSVEQAARGLGLGRALICECIEFARQVGYRRIELWTQDFLLPARKLYQDAGFVMTRAEANRSFGCDMVSETWELDLQSDSRAC